MEFKIRVYIAVRSVFSLLSLILRVCAIFFVSLEIKRSYPIKSRARSPVQTALGL